MEKKKNKTKPALGHNESLYLVQHRANRLFQCINIGSQLDGETCFLPRSDGGTTCSPFPCRAAHAQLSSFSPHSVALHSVWHRGCCSNACPIFFNTLIQVRVNREHSTGLGMQCLKVICSS